MIDSNEVGGFILQCKQPAYLHYLQGIIEQRLVEIGHTDTPPCPQCGGKKMIAKKTKDGIVEKPCPACNPTAATTDQQKSIDEMATKLSALQEAVIQRNSTIDEQKAEIARLQEMLKTTEEPKKVEPATV